jgi:hypothetical protein
MQWKVLVVPCPSYGGGGMKFKVLVVCYPGYGGRDAV